MQPSVLMAVEQAAVVRAVVLVPVGAPGLEAQPEVRAVMVAMVVLAEALPEADRVQAE